MIHFAFHLSAVFLSRLFGAGATASNDPASSTLKLVRGMRTLCAQSYACIDIFRLKMERGSGSCFQGEPFSSTHKFFMHIIRQYI